MAILLIRHGETDCNINRIVQFPETPLGDNGHLQADQLGRALKSRPIVQIISSDYQRAKTTAERLAAHVGLDFTQSANLRERNFGDIRGTPYDDLGEIDIFTPGYVPPNGESWEVFNARVDRAWDEVTRCVDGLSGDLAVVTHGLVLRSLIDRVLDVSEYVIEPDVVVANTSVTIVEHEPPWRVVDFAGVGHLEQGSRDGAAV
jgi:broad specificity phosphatase PhoE